MNVRTMALDALKLAVLQNGCDMIMTGEELRKCESAIAALEADIAQEVEPVAWIDGDCIVTFGHMKYGFIDRRDRAIPDSWKPLYTTPPEPAVNAAFEPWVAVSDRLPVNQTLVMVYTPPNDREDERFDLDGCEEDIWVAHAEHYDHYMMVGGSHAGGPDVECTGPSESAPYTHWAYLRSPSKTAQPSAVNAELLAELRVIADANPMNWDAPYNDTASFQAWAQSRARATIAKATS